MLFGFESVRIEAKVRLFPLNDHNGWFRKLYPSKRNCSFICSLIWKFLKSPRSELKKAGP